MNLGGHNPDEVNYLRVYADNKTANPDFLSDVFLHMEHLDKANLDLVEWEWL